MSKRLTRIASIAIVILLIFTQTASWANYSVDITKIGTGARPMGMGRAYVALADDTSAMYMNPAGLGQFSSMRFHSMQTTLLGDINYLTLGGTTPVGIGCFGTSILQASISGIAITELDENYRPKVVDEVTYKDTMWTASYGLPLINDRVYAGITGKYFQKGVSGIAEGRGINADIGLLYKINNHWNIGLVQKNALASLGSITWDTGAVDELVSNTTVGLAYKVDPAWVILADYDFSFTTKRKALFHFGTEYTFGDFLAGRIGWEQVHDSIGAETYGHPTMGLSLTLLGMSVDYAYQPYYEIAENTTHFISFRYNFDRPGAPLFHDEKLTQEEEPPEGTPGDLSAPDFVLDPEDINNGIEEERFEKISEDFYFNDEGHNNE